MDWKHLGAITLGAGCLVAAALIPATAPVLGPIGGTLLLMSDPRKIMPKKGEDEKK